MFLSKKFALRESLTNFFRDNRALLVIFLSVVTLVGSGVSLGLGVAETRRDDPITVVGAEKIFGDEITDYSSEGYLEGRVNINTASLVELDLLPGIGVSVGSAIQTQRERQCAIPRAPRDALSHVWERKGVISCIWRNKTSASSSLLPRSAIQAADAPRHCPPLSISRRRHPLPCFAALGHIHTSSFSFISSGQAGLSVRERWHTSNPCLR